MRERPPQTIDALHGVEGRVAQMYSRSWRPIELKWKGRKPIPEEWRRIGPRVSPKGGTNRDAMHPVNAMLNYGYSVGEPRRIVVLAADGRFALVIFLEISVEQRALPEERTDVRSLHAHGRPV